MSQTSAEYSLVANTDQQNTEATTASTFSAGSIISSILSFPLSKSVDSPSSAFSSSATTTSTMSDNTNTAAAPGGPTNSVLGIDPAEVQGLLSQVKSRKWLATLRPLPTFAGQTLFSKPRTSAEAMARLEANLPFFLTNYLILCSIIVIITVLSQPSLLFIGGLLLLMWIVAGRNETLQIGAVALQGRAKHLALSGVSGLVLFLFAGTTIFFLVGICASLVIGHSIFHELPPLDEAEMNDFNNGNSVIPPV